MKKIAFVACLLLIVNLACDQDSPTDPNLQTPVISDFIIADTLYTSSANTDYMSVVVEDPQGPADVAQVTVDITAQGSSTIIRTDTLYDDGATGDVIAGDGAFSAPVDPDFAPEGGTFVYKITAVDQSGNIGQANSTPVVIIVGAENLPPVISNASVPALVDLNSTGEYIISVMASDPEDINQVKSVKCDIYNPEAPSIPNQTVVLTDDGENGDTVSDDGVFTAKITVGFAKAKVGTFSFRFQATDQNGGLSNVLVQLVQVMNAENLAPEIADLSAPDTLQLSSTEIVVFAVAVRASDPQGLSDIARVYFNSYLPPDGRPASNNPFNLNDSGDLTQHGDQTEGDGIYSLLLKMPPGTPSGTYRFVFEAVDRSGAVSNQIEHFVILTN